MISMYVVMELTYKLYNSITVCFLVYTMGDPLGINDIDGNTSFQKMYLNNGYNLKLISIPNLVARFDTVFLRKARRTSLRKDILATYKDLLMYDKMYQA